MTPISKHEYLLGEGSEICRAFSVAKAAGSCAEQVTGYCGHSCCMADIDISTLHLCF